MKEYVKRYVDLDRILDRKSVFLIGPRMCGKSMYAKNEGNRCFTIEFSKKAPSSKRNERW